MGLSEYWNYQNNEIISISELGVAYLLYFLFTQLK
jgi:hypothetical protein